MSNNFSWQTDDDVVWDDSAADVGETAASRRRPWLTFLIIIVAIVAVGTLIYRQVDERVETVTGNVENDILASHNLLQQAVLQNDVELFNTLLSGRSAAWSSVQTELMGEGRLYERELLGLHWLPPADVNSRLSDIEMDIDPELNAAELRFVQEYVIEVGNGVTETVFLQQTAVYRRGAQRWLLSPPAADFWGKSVTVQGTILTLAYLERDELVAERLAFDLDAKLNEMCRTLPALDCPDDLRVHLRLSGELNSLLRIADPISTLVSGLRLELPAPTLAGLPVDEAGYQALYRGYAAWVAAALVTQFGQSEFLNYWLCAQLAGNGYV